MEIHWNDMDLKKRLEDGRLLMRQYDEKVAKKVAQRMRELANSPTYAQLPPASHPHPIHEKGRFACFAIDVPGIGEKRGKLRLLFKPFGEHDLVHVETIIAVEIIGLKDYH